MLNAACRFSFTAETFNRGLIGNQFIVEDFNRELSIEMDVCGAVNFSHSSLAEQRFDAVSPVERLPDNRIDQFQRLAVFWAKGERLIENSATCIAFLGFYRIHQAFPQSTFARTGGEYSQVFVVNGMKRGYG